MFMEYLFLAIESMNIKDEEHKIWEKIKKFSSDCGEEALSAKGFGFSLATILHLNSFNFTVDSQVEMPQYCLWKHS